jgi:hypothetical protein
MLRRFSNRSEALSENTAAKGSDKSTAMSHSNRPPGLKAKPASFGWKHKAQASGKGRNSQKAASKRAPRQTGELL